MHEDIYTQIIGEYVLVIELVIICLIGVAWWFADQKQYQNHKQVIQIVIVGQTVLTAIMFLRILTSEYARQFWIHAAFGLFVFILILYTYLSMSRKLPPVISVPQKYRKNFMYFTGTLWGFTVLTGFISFMLIAD